jgi:hypothetical protein
MMSNFTGFMFLAIVWQYPRRPVYGMETWTGSSIDVPGVFDRQEGLQP